jgi:hypothetical protein
MPLSVLAPVAQACQNSAGREALNRTIEKCSGPDTYVRERLRVGQIVEGALAWREEPRDRRWEGAGRG